MIRSFTKIVIVSSIVFVTSVLSFAVDFPNLPSFLVPLNQPPRQLGAISNQKTQPVEPLAVNDVMNGEQPIGDPNTMVDPTFDTATPAMDPLGGNPLDAPDTGFVPEPEKKVEDGSSVTKPSSSEYFVRVIPVTKMNLASLSKSLGVRTANINNSHASSNNDWWSNSDNAASSTSSSSSGSSGTSGNFASTKLKDSQEDIKRLMTIYQAVDYDYQQLYTQAFNMTVLKDASITAAIRDLRVKHDKLASDINDRWRLSDTKAINAMQDRVMEFQVDIDDIRAMDDSLKSPTAKTGAGAGATDVNAQLQQVQAAYQQAMTQFANNPRYLTQLNSVKANIATAQAAISSGSGTGTGGKKGGKGGGSSAATTALQTATTTLASLGIQVNSGTNQTTGNPLLNQQQNQFGNQQQYGVQQPYNQFGTQQQYGVQQPYNQYGTQQQYGVQQPYNQYGTQQQYGNQQYGNQQYGNQQYGNQQYGNQQYGNQQYGNQQYGNQQYGNQQQYGNTSGDPKSQFAQLEAQYNAAKAKSTGNVTTAQKNELNSIMSNVNTLRSQVNNPGYLNNQNNYNNLMTSLNNLQTKVDTYKSTYNISDTTTTNADGTTTATSETDTLSASVQTINTDMQGIEDAIRNFSPGLFPKISNILSGINTNRTQINQIQLDLMNAKPNLSTIKTRISQASDRVNQLKRDVYEIEQQVLTYTRNLLSNLRTTVNNSTDVVKNSYTGQVDTHTDDLRSLETDFNTPSFIKDPSNQKDWSSRILDLTSSIQSTQINVKTAIANN